MEQALAEPKRPARLPPSLGAAQPRLRASVASEAGGPGAPGHRGADDLRAAERLPLGRLGADEARLQRGLGRPRGAPGAKKTEKKLSEAEGVLL